MRTNQDARQQAVNAAALANAGRGLNTFQMIEFAKRLLEYIEEGK